MKIALLVPPYLPVPPKGYGGTERIVSYLADGLVKRGHEVTLFASGDSKTSAKLISIFPEALGNSGELKTKPLYPLLQYIECFTRASQFEIIHNHAQYFAMPLSDLVKTPVVHTLHGTVVREEIPEDKSRTLDRFRNHNFISISNNQREGRPDLNWTATVYNGIKIEDYPFRSEKGNYLLWMGRIVAKKGPVEAIETAKRAGMPLKMAAAIDPIDRPFYEEKVKPLIDGKNIQFLGEVDGKEKADLYGRAAATLYPISWHEPFGLVMAESMACGTPVIAYNEGSVPEVVEDGVTGYIIQAPNPKSQIPNKLQIPNLKIQKEGIEGLVEAVKRIGEIKREDCRKRVEEKFTVEKMVEGYENALKEVVK